MLSLSARLEGGWDLTLLKLVPVYAAKKWVFHDSFATLGAIAEPLVNVSGQQTLQQALRIAAHECCSRPEASGILEVLC